LALACVAALLFLFSWGKGKEKKSEVDRELIVTFVVVMSLKT